MMLDLKPDQSNATFRQGVYKRDSDSNDHYTELKIRGGKEVNSKIFSYLSIKTYFATHH